MCMRRTPRAHPESREGIDLNRNHLYQKQRVRVGAVLVVLDQENAFIAGGGRERRLFNSAFVRPPCATSIIPLQEELYERVFSLVTQILHC